MRLVSSGASSAFYNMALDEALSVFARKGGSGPTLRLYGWDRPSVSLGRNQRAGLLDLDHCAQAGIPVVRRPTGGRAILHGEELTYSFSAPVGIRGLGTGVLESYEALSHAFMHAFNSLGLSAMSTSKAKKSASHASTNPLCFSSASYGEISVSGRKIIGSAQRRWPDGFLQQGSIPLKLDREGMSRVFAMDADAYQDMAGLCEFDSDITLERLCEAVVRGFGEVFSVEVALAPPDKEEEALARKLEEEKYSQEGWTLNPLNPRRGSRRRSRQGQP
ncbi:MAG: lipoate--protein ligase family protein [Thermodesulfovibrionales bacterium]|nr:lipoate--protein ligase family protein [Thermodesulfovibrionales bacterium]